MEFLLELGDMLKLSFEGMFERIEIAEVQSHQVFCLFVGSLSSIFLTGVIVDI